MNLETWLTTVTQNLAPRAAAKVREEITAHIASASHAYQLEGRSELEAEALAVTDLGDAVVSARRFERAYLMKKELNSLVKDKEQASKSIGTTVFWFAMLVYYLSTFISSSNKSISDFGALIFIPTLTISYLSDFLSAKFFDLRKYVIIKLAFYSLFFISIIISIIFMYHEDRSYPILMIFLFLASVAMVFDLRNRFIFWRKLLLT